MGMGYTRVSHLKEGISGWMEGGGPVEAEGADAVPSKAHTRPADGASSVRSSRAPVSAARRRFPLVGLVQTLGERSISQLLGLWLWMILVFSGLYWFSGSAGGIGLRRGDVPVPANLGGFMDALYFSFVTALSIGYGDVIPVGAVRALAVAEGAMGLLVFGVVISKLVSRHQDQLIGEIHRTTFEERLGRVRINLHLVLSELQALAAMCGDPAVPGERLMARVESTSTVFAGELRNIHDLLYRPRQLPEEAALETILANLAASLREMCELLVCLPRSPGRSATFKKNLHNMAILADEICGECVPRDYAPELKVWMDDIQRLAGRLN